MYYNNIGKTPAFVVFYFNLWQRRIHQDLVKTLQEFKFNLELIILNK